MTYEEIISHFDVKETYTDRVQCICPKHADKEASLTISKGEKGVVMHCHANCETAEILEKVGLKMSDLFADDPTPITGERWRAYVEGKEKRKIEDRYDYYDVNGQYAFTRLRLSGKKFKYGKMEGDRFKYGLNGKRRETIPAVFCNSVNGLKKAVENGQRVFYCEGEKDVKTLNSHGLTGVTCGAAGDWCQGCATLFVGADVVIFADNDKPGIKSAKDIEKNLHGVAKSVRVVIPTPDIPKGDISDFFKNHTVEDLEELLKEESKEDPEDDFLDLDQFHHINEMTGKVTGVYDYAILQYLKEKEDLFVLGQIPFIYENGVHRPNISGAKLKTMIRGLIYPEFIKSTTIKRIYDLFISDDDLQVKMEDLNRYPVRWINFRNGFYDPVTKKMIPHDPKYRAINQIPHSFDPFRGVMGAVFPEWLDSVTGSPEDLEMLLQFSGLCLTRDTRQQKFMILLGDGGTGKSTVIRVIDLMIGADNISNISLNQLTQRFSAFGLMGKLLNSCADLEIDALSDVSTLKKCLGEDTLSAEAKGKDAISFKSYAKLIFSTNELPIVKAEKTNGFYRRLLILTMNRVPEKKDPYFFDKLSDEIDDFIYMSVKALERLYENGEITESPGSVEAVKRLRCDSDTVEAFLTEKIVRSPDYKIKKADLYRDYEAYCQDMERQSLTKQNFYRSMKVKGYGEIKTNGTEYFKGIFYRGNLPKPGCEISLNDQKGGDDEENPFV